MNSKKFEYYHKDITQLKKDIFFRMLFATLLLIIFGWQLISMVITSTQTELNIVQIATSLSVLITSLFLASLIFMFIFKDFRIIAAIKMNGKCVSSVQILFKTDKKSFIKLYSYLIQFLTLATALVMISSVTYAILEATYFSKISYYMPLLMLICVSGFSSIYHIKDEIRTQNTVQEYNALY